MADPKRNSYDELADRIRAMCRSEAKAVSPAVERWKVVSTAPLIVENEDGDQLAEGDPDVEFDRALIHSHVIARVEGLVDESVLPVLVNAPEVGDTVRVHHDGQDWIVSGSLL